MPDSGPAFWLALSGWITATVVWLWDRREHVVAFVERMLTAEHIGAGQPPPPPPQRSHVRLVRDRHEEA